jgi:excisionase family DNA binding protein
MTKNSKRIRIFSALEVANICGVVNQTAINWIRNGHLKAFVTPGGQYRIYAKDLAAFLDKRGMNAPDEVLQNTMETANWSNLMIAADKPTNDAIKSQLERLFPNYNITQATDWFNIGRKIIENKPGLVLLDTALHGGNVSEFIQTVRSDTVFGQPYIIILTDISSDNNINAAADAVLIKPLDISKLEASVKAALGKQSEMAEASA